MLSVGQNVSFKRSSGEWNKGFIKDINQDFVTVQSVENGLIGTKKVHVLFIQSTSRKKYFVLVILAVILFLLIDSYVYLKKVIF